MADWRGEKSPLWDVIIREHTVRVGPNRTITVPPGTQEKIGAADERKARMYAIRQAHRMCDIPPWKPCIRESWPYATAVEREDPYTKYK